MATKHNNLKKIYLIISIITIITGLILSITYRPYIYKNHIFDFGFADTIGSLVSVIGICSSFWAFKAFSNKEKNKHIVIATITYALIWEPMGLINIHGTFDKKDILATFISGLITFIIKTMVEKNIKSIISKPNPTDE